MRTTVLAKQGAPEGRSALECNVQRIGTLHGDAGLAKRATREARNESLSAEYVVTARGHRQTRCSAEADRIERLAHREP